MGVKDDAALWRIEPHICSACFGRILSRPSSDGEGRLYHCADCGLEREGAQARIICTCGMKLNARTAGIHCGPNLKKSPEFPFEICAIQS